MPEAVSDRSGDLLTRLLKQVSRSFYLTLRVLPGRVRQPIGLAYLLARSTDTLADTEILPVTARLAALSELRERILGRSEKAWDYQAFLAHQGTPSERELLVRVEEALTLLDRTDEADRADIREVLSIITRGQESDLHHFGTPEPGRVIALETMAALDDYTWRVAGCVGQFWTRICRRHLFPDLGIDVDALIRDGVRFGKGLQLVNILRDLAVDLRSGRCYLPLERLQARGLRPEDLLVAESESHVREVIEEPLELARAHLSAGWSYTNRLPRSQRRIRLACAWPILMGAATLCRLKRASVLDLGCRVKIPRREVYGIMVRSILRLGRSVAWERQFAEVFEVGRWDEPLKPQSVSSP